MDEWPQYLKTSSGQGLWKVWILEGRSRINEKKEHDSSQGRWWHLGHLPVLLDLHSAAVEFRKAFLFLPPYPIAQVLRLLHVACTSFSASLYVYLNIQKVFFLTYKGHILSTKHIWSCHIHVAVCLAHPVCSRKNVLQESFLNTFRWLIFNSLSAFL